MASSFSSRLAVASVALLSAGAVLGHSDAAFAYGSEGIFGGRGRPDNTVALVSQIQQMEERPQRAQSVVQHPRPDYDQVPWSVGSFDFFPLLEAGLLFDSNIYSAVNHEKDDETFNARPALTAFSNWNRHAVSLTTFGDLNFHQEYDNENYKDFVIEAQGRYDVQAQTWLSTKGGYQYISEPRSSPDNAGGSEPTKVNVYKAGVSGYRGVGVVKAGLDYNMMGLRYEDTPASSGRINQSGRDRNEHVIGGRVSYDLSENFKPYVKANGNFRDYESNNSRDSDGFDAVAGVTADFGGITSADAYVGWMQQDYDNFGISESNGAVKFGGRVEWNVTGLTSLVLEVDRTLEETTLAAYSSMTASGGSATLTHELLRNLLVEGDVSLTRYDYNGNGDRQNEVLSAGLGARWLINRTIYADINYKWADRSSTVSAIEYDKHIAGIRVGVQM